MSEYVYNPDGSFAGIVRQQRQLHQLKEDVLRVIQHCHPEEPLSAHPMGEFVGERVFDLKVEGRARRYLGPDVVGTGLTWGPELMSGKGHWPLFGHNFTSYAAKTHDDRQVTGGKFYNASEMIANIIGIGIDDRGQDYPEFSGPDWPSDVAEVWEGSCVEFDGEGNLMGEDVVKRVYANRFEWHDEVGMDVTHIRLDEWGPRYRVGGLKSTAVFSGLAKKTGWQLEIDVMLEPGVQIVIQEILDNEKGQLVSMRSTFVDHSLSQVAYWLLKTK